MDIIFIIGTAGSGKSLLTANLIPWYNEKGNYTIGVNLDPGAINLPYEPDIDIRDYIDINLLMKNYGLGPNGALILASDLISTNLPELQEELNSLNPDIAIIDTPGQMELFAFRSSGPYIAENIKGDNKALIFLFDSILLSTPSNFLSIALLASSIQLRLKLPQVSALSKKDLGEHWKKAMSWSSNVKYLEEELRRDYSGNNYLLNFGLLRSLLKLGMGFELIPISSVTMEGFVELSATLTRILRGGEEVQD
ncbi:MAG: ATP/GTP-binding protein [Nitrososphaerales archaeon]